jgi:hypothetical protein
MNYKPLFFLLLISATAIHSMDKKDLIASAIIYNLAPRLDRDDRTALKLTDNFFCKIITPQHILNEQYQLACATDNTAQMDDLRNKGALTIQEEAYKLFLNNKKKLIIQIVPKHQPKVIRTLFFYGIEQNNGEFVQWFLNTKKPYYASPLIDDAYKHATSLNYHTISRLIKEYEFNGEREHINKLKEEIIAMPEEIDELKTDTLLLRTRLDKYPTTYATPQQPKKTDGPCTIS